MIKGLTKKVILIKCDKECEFEQALLFLRNGETDTDEDNIIEAANRIIGAAELGRARREKAETIFKYCVAFAAGVALGVFLFIVW